MNTTPNRLRGVLGVLGALAMLHVPSLGEAQATCAPQDEGAQVSDHRLLRQLSLDLLGRIPTMDEWQRLDGGASIDEVLLPEMLDSDEYYARVREQHRALLWGSLGNIDNVGPGGRLISMMRTPRIWRAGNMRRRYRGVNTMDCLDQLQTNFDANGHPVPIRVITGADAVSRGCDPADGVRGSEPPECRQEGYVMVRPYWAPDTEVKVCAYDAQTIAEDEAGRSCLDSYNAVSRLCGCGPNLRNCQTSGQTSVGQAPLRAALEEEPARIFENVIRERRSYLEAFTTRESFVNGPSAHYYRHLTGIYNPRAGGQITYDARMGELPDLAFTESDTWEQVTRGEEHAGVLTTLGYLLRFASNRARANRFYTAFRCEPFVPPAEGLPEDTSAVPNPNLRERTGCDSCHSRLEPLSSHWGRWRGNGSHGYMDDELVSIGTEDSCMGCGGEGQRNCSAFCNAYFVTGANSDPGMVAEWEGYPLAAAWLDEEEQTAIDIGPAALVDEDSEKARVAACTVRTVAERLFGRELTQDESVVWVPEMASSFAEGGYDYSALVSDIVQSETYRAIR